MTSEFVSWLKNDVISWVRASRNWVILLNSESCRAFFPEV